MLATYLDAYYPFAHSAPTWTVVCCSSVATTRTLWWKYTPAPAQARRCYAHDMTVSLLLTASHRQHPRPIGVIADPPRSLWRLLARRFCSLQIDRFGRKSEHSTQSSWMQIRRHTLPRAGCALLRAQWTNWILKMDNYSSRYVQVTLTLQERGR